MRTRERRHNKPADGVFPLLAPVWGATRAGSRAPGAWGTPGARSPFPLACLRCRERNSCPRGSALRCKNWKCPWRLRLVESRWGACTGRGGQPGLGVCSRMAGLDGRDLPACWLAAAEHRGSPGCGPLGVACAARWEGCGRLSVRGRDPHDLGEWVAAEGQGAGGVYWEPCWGR